MNEITVFCYFILLSTISPGYESFKLDINNDNIIGNHTLSRIRRQASNACNGDSSKFQCETTPECIDSDLQCDGKEDCSDGSDEKPALCKSVPCPGYLFQCEYGACISSDKRCNGEKDCKDNSDELGCPSTFEKINTNCRSDEFECDNGQCIDTDGRCNGIAECEDKSDETERLCLNIECPGYTYKCKYGACVDGTARCDGIEQCIDNSDENSCGPTTPSPPVSPVTPVIGDRSKMCITPPQPDNGQWTYFSDSNKNAVPNVAVPAMTQMVFKCNNKYKLSTTNEQDHIVYCREDNQWSLTVFPHCQRLCPAQYNRQHVILQCKLDGSIIPCDKATDETVLTYTCDNYYEPEFEGPSTCRDGSWFMDPKCKIVCGEKQVSAQTLVVNGNNVTRGQYPWVVALYSDRESSPDYTNICGGSLLSTSIVLTAAHCVTYQETGKEISAHYFQVAGGKYYNPFGDPRDNDTAQYSGVEKILKHEEYRGQIRNFQYDIALLKLTKPLALSKVVQPVCTTYSSLLTERRPTTVTGWGYTSAIGLPSDVLKEIDLPYIDNLACSEELDPDFANQYLIPDKLCAGYLNKNMSVCKGDSGGGLVVKGDRNRYYIQGIVSLAHAFYENNQRSCNIQKRSLFTRVQVYSEWIETKKQLIDKKTVNIQKRSLFRRVQVYSDWIETKKQLLDNKKTIIS